MEVDTEIAGRGERTPCLSAGEGEQIDRGIEHATEVRAIGGEGEIGLLSTQHKWAEIEQCSVGDGVPQVGSGGWDSVEEEDETVKNG